MRDTEDAVVCATSANLFVLHEGRWCTPPIDRCGVAGVCREYLLEHVDASVARLSMAQVKGADAVFLCNAVRGILPLARIGTRTWTAGHPAIADVVRRLAGIHPGFASITSITERS
jgi:4-amino-4-deoxychorismate lyase